MAKEMRILAVAGDWNEDGGKPSGFFNKLMMATFCKMSLSNKITSLHFENGGVWNDYTISLRGTEWKNKIADANIIFWFANIPNALPKAVREIKKINPKCILITSKNNLDGKYSHFDMTKRALQIKSNLFLEIKKHDDRFVATIYDPLGNIFGEEGLGDNTDYIAQFLSERVKQLHNFTRMKSISICTFPIEPPDQPEFFQIIRDYSKVFHDLIHGDDMEMSRFMGNASFRCESGFPSFKTDERIFVSRRNVDKRELERNNFIAVENKDTYVGYYGTVKPSVDTPIQVRLYDAYKNIRFMLHSHVYIEKAGDIPIVKTNDVISCGALEEIASIMHAMNNFDTKGFAVNLQGHGSLVLVDSVDKLRNIKYVARHLPEINTEWLEGDTHD